MKPIMLLACALTLGGALPGLAQTGAGTPPLSSSPSANALIPLKNILPGSKDSSGALMTNKTTYAPGQRVSLTFAIFNHNKTTTAYNFPTAQQYDFIVSDAKGAEVWRWSKGRTFAQNLTLLRLAPGERRTFSAAWNGRDAQGRVVSPGIYTVKANLTSINRPAITGGVVVNRDTDPTNMGVPTRTQVDTGAVREVDVNPPISASATITIAK